MTHKNLTILLAVLMSMVASVASAHDFEVDGIYYEITSSTDNTVAVSYRGSSYDSYSNEYSGDVVIPETITYNGTTYSVTSIGASAFEGCTGLTSVTIPNSVTLIRSSAFYECTGLTSVTIGAGVTEIGGSAFKGCTGLKELFIADGEGTLSLGYIYIGSGDTKGGLFYHCPLETVYLGRNLSYSESPFKGKTGLTSVTIGESVTRIGYSAFWGCTGLTSITIPESVNKIGYYAFEGCTGLTSIAIPSGVTALENYAFAGCENLASVTIPENLVKIGASAFENCYGLTSLVIPESVVSIGSSAFDGCKLRNVLVKCPTPPEARSSSFSDPTHYHTVLYVPTNSWDAYAYDSGWYAFINIRETALADSEAKPNETYTLMDTRTFTYAVYDPVNNQVSMISSIGVDENNPNHCWQTVEKEGRRYLYNIGARMFAVSSTDGSSFTLTRSVGSIDMTDGKDGIVMNGHDEQQWALVSNDRANSDKGLDELITAIQETTAAETAPEAYYSIDGKRGRSHGVNVIRNMDGTTKKVLVK